MILQNTLFFAACTCRSQAYAQALVNADMHPENTLVYGDEKSGLPGQNSTVSGKAGMSQNGLFLPDLSLPLVRILKMNRLKYVRSPAVHVNEKDILDKISEISPKLVIYSGYGSQIVPASLLDLGIPFLHVHSGWLPDYRGSTTLYYSWLKENNCAASAILLEREIDTGPVIRRERYPAPPCDIDPDYVYDAAIRADLLIKVLKEDYKNGKFVNLMPQSKEGKTYFVIHPVLKHLARMSKK